jgi:hypothetical protein
MFFAASTGKALIFWRQLRRQCLWHGPRCPPGSHAPLPQPRFCAYAPCGIMLDRDAPAVQRYCKPTHKNKARQQRAKPRRKLEAAWTLNGTYEAHAVSCARKTIVVIPGVLPQPGHGVHGVPEAVVGAAVGRSIYKCLCCDKFHITSHADRVAG